MDMKASRTLVLLLLLGAAFAAGCATTDENEVSTIPWNRPESWEGMGALGGFGGMGGMNRGRY
jgi:hypothetical protein